jgi:transposase
MTGKNRRTISKFHRRRRVRGSEENLPRSGRGRKTGVPGARIMHRMLRSDRRKSLGEITDQFNRQFVTTISSRTVRRRLNFEGYKKHPVCKKTTISPVNREKRKRLCRSKLMWTVRNHWKKLFSVMRRRLRLEIRGKFMFGVKWMKD